MIPPAVSAATLSQHEKTGNVCCISPTTLITFFVCCEVLGVRHDGAGTLSLHSGENAVMRSGQQGKNPTKNYIFKLLLIKPFCTYFSLVFYISLLTHVNKQKALQVKVYLFS